MRANNSGPSSIAPCPWPSRIMIRLTGRAACTGAFTDQPWAAFSVRVSPVRDLVPRCLATRRRWRLGLISLRIPAKQTRGRPRAKRSQECSYQTGHEPTHPQSAHFATTCMRSDVCPVGLLPSRSRRPAPAPDRQAHPGRRRARMFRAGPQTMDPRAMGAMLGIALGQPGALRSTLR